MKSPRTKLRRLPKRGAHDRETIDAILDEAMVCHLGFVHDGRPAVIPTLHARVGDEVLIHGSAASRALRALATGIEVCLTVTLIDGLVLARSAFHHSVNYRSVVLYGTARPLTETEELERALEAFTEKLVPGRWADVRWPTRKELKGTAALALPIDRGLGQGPHRAAGRRRRGLRARRLGGRGADARPRRCRRCADPRLRDGHRSAARTCSSLVS